MNLGLFAAGLLIGGAIALMAIGVGVGIGALADRAARKEPRP